MKSEKIAIFNILDKVWIFATVCPEGLATTTTFGLYINDRLDTLTFPAVSAKMWPEG